MDLPACNTPTSTSFLETRDGVRALLNCIKPATQSRYTLKVITDWSLAWHSISLRSSLLSYLPLHTRLQNRRRMFLFCPNFSLLSSYCLLSRCKKKNYYKGQLLNIIMGFALQCTSFSILLKRKKKKKKKNQPGKPLTPPPFNIAALNLAIHTEAEQKKSRDEKAN